MIPSRPLIACLPVAAMATDLAALSAPGIAHGDSYSTMGGYAMPGAIPGPMHVTKSPTRGCRSAPVAMARGQGRAVRTTDIADLAPVKTGAGLTDGLRVCHTAMIDGHVVEGDGPFGMMAPLPEMRPDKARLGVPGIPARSPGMGNAPATRFDVIAFGGSARDGRVYFRLGR